MINIYKSLYSKQVFIEGVKPAFPEDFSYSRNLNNFNIVRTSTGVTEINKAPYDLFIGRDSLGNPITFSTAQLFEDYLNEILTLDLFGGDKTFEMIIGTPSINIQVPHNLGKYPSIEIIDSSGNIWIVDVNHIDKNNAILENTTPLSGKIIAN